MKLNISLLILSLFQYELIFCLKNNNYNKIDYEENLKCTEFKETIDSGLILHVPCILIRLVERLKQCQFDLFKDAFLGLPKYFSSNKLLRFCIILY